MIENNGGASRARTDDLIVANDALSQLSYSPSLAETNRATSRFYQCSLAWARRRPLFRVFVSFPLRPASRYSLCPVQLEAFYG